MRGAPGTLSVFWPNNIILPKLGMGGSLQYLQGSPGTLLCSGGVSSMFYRGPRGPLVRHNIFCKHFVAGLGEACKVPPISAGVPASCVRIPSLFHIASGVTRRKRVGVLFFCRNPQRLVGGKRVWFLQFLQASLPHMSGFPPFLTLPQASGRGSV